MSYLAKNMGQITSALQHASPMLMAMSQSLAAGRPAFSNAQGGMAAIMERDRLKRQEKLQAEQAAQMAAHRDRQFALQQDANDRASQLHNAQMGAFQDERRNKFIQSILPYAIEQSKRTNIDPRIIVAQAALETGFGESVPGNNLFGIKSHGQAGGQVLPTNEVINGETVRVNDSFRTYNSPAESVAGYADFILENPRYADFRGAQGLEAQIAALQASGYATDPDYGRKVLAIARLISLPQAEAPKPLTQIAKLNADRDAGLITPDQHARGMAKVASQLPDVDGEGSLRKEFVGLPAVKDFSKQADAFGRIIAAGTEPSAAGDMALIFNFMKLLDPGSTVREGEFATAQNAGGVGSRIAAQYNAIVSGERLAPEQRADFLNRANRLYKTAESRFDALYEQYQGKAQSYGFNPERSLVNFRSNASAPSQPTPTAAPNPAQPQQIPNAASIRGMTRDQFRASFLTWDLSRLTLEQREAVGEMAKRYQ